MAAPVIIQDKDDVNRCLEINADGSINALVSTGDIEIGAVEIKDGTTDTRAKVLAASTAAGATDTPLVVALHPSSPLGAGTAAIGKLAANSGVDIGDVDVTTATITDTTIDDYETIAASQTAQVLGATGAAGDYIVGVLVIPATTSPGNVILLDNATSITIFTGGSASVSSLVPFRIELGMKSVSGAWKLTTGANVSCIGIGKFT